MAIIKRIIKSIKTKNLTNKQLPATSLTNLDNLTNRNNRNNLGRKANNLIFFFKVFFSASVFLILLIQVLTWFLPDRFNKDTDGFLKQLNDFFHI